MQSIKLMVHITPQPLYNTIVGFQAYFRVSYPIHVVLNHVIKKSRCN